MLIGKPSVTSGGSADKTSADTAEDSDTSLPGMFDVVQLQVQP